MNESNISPEKVDRIPASTTTTKVSTEQGKEVGEKPKLVFVTGNANKLKEVREILSSSPFFPFLLTNQDLDLDEIQGTTREVAEAKCSAASERLGGPCITEDTALGFDALEGLPGPYIKHFLKSLGHSGLNRLLDGFQDRSAQAICTFAYSPGPGQPVVLFEGITRGTIVQPRGPPIFGWDPVFEVQGTGLTYAEMPLEQKNLLSHRYKALSLLQDYLCKLGSSS